MTSANQAARLGVPRGAREREDAWGFSSPPPSVLRLVAPALDVSPTGFDVQRADTAKSDEVLRRTRLRSNEVARYTRPNDSVAIAPNWAAVESDEALDLETAIGHSRSILDLRDDWDEAGAPGYQSGTWERAIGLLRSHARAALLLARTIPVPRILAGPNGSIDLHWRSADSEILLNVPADERQPIDFYGDDRSGGVVRGALPSATSKATLLPWLIRP